MDKQKQQGAELFADLVRARLVVSFTGPNAPQRAFAFAAAWEGQRSATRWRTKNNHPALDSDGVGVTNVWSFPEFSPTWEGARIVVEHHGEQGFERLESWRGGFQAAAAILEKLAREYA